MSGSPQGGRVLPHDWFPRPLPSNVHLGEESWLYSSFAFLHYRSRRPRGVRVGNHTGIYEGTFFELGARGEVTIGDYCTVVGAIIRSEERVVIQDYVFIAHEVFLADSFAAVPPAGLMDKEDRPGGRETPRTSIFIGKNAWIGTRAVLLGGARIGEGAVVGAAAVVNFEVPPYTVVAGNPAREVKALVR